MTFRQHQTTEQNLSSIEKYDGTFEQDELGVTLIPTETIQAIRNPFDLALFVFLASCPKTWKLIPKYLAAHFSCNKDRVYKSLESLIEQGFITRTEVRQKGKFANYHYQLHLRNTKISCPKTPVLEKPEPVNPDTYKTYNIKNKDFKNNKKDLKTLVLSEERTKKDGTLFSEETRKKKVSGKKITAVDYRGDERFMKVMKAYPIKKKTAHAYKMWLRLNPDDERVGMILEDIEKRMVGDSQWIDGFIPHLGTYLNPECPGFEDEIFNREALKRENHEKIKAEQAEQGRKNLEKQAEASRKRAEQERLEEYNKQADAVAYRKISRAISENDKRAIERLKSIVK